MSDGGLLSSGPFDKPCPRSGPHHMVLAPSCLFCPELLCILPFLSIGGSGPFPVCKVLWLARGEGNAAQMQFVINPVLAYITPLCPMFHLSRWWMAVSWVACVEVDTCTARPCMHNALLWGC